MMRGPSGNLPWRRGNGKGWPPVALRVQVLRHSTWVLDLEEQNVAGLPLCPVQPLSLVRQVSSQAFEDVEVRIPNVIDDRK